MIKRLDQLSMAMFIELLCGDNSVLLDSGETVERSALENQAVLLIIDYKNIANPVEMKSLLIEKEDIIKENVKILILQICKSLIIINAFRDVRIILKELCIDTFNTSDDVLAKRVDNLLHSALCEQKRNEKNRMEADFDKKTDVRSLFDEELAFLMTYYRMPIDINIISASVYANMVQRVSREIRHEKMKK